jgi:hypothetical protein
VDRFSRLNEKLVLFKLLVNKLLAYQGKLLIRQRHYFFDMYPQFMLHILTTVPSIPSLDDFQSAIAITNLTDLLKKAM